MTFRMLFPLVAFLVAGCDTRSAREDAITEVETACGLKHGDLQRSAAEKAAREGQFATAGRSERETRKVIDLGQVWPDSSVGSKRECINGYQSKDGYRFGLSFVSPTVLPNLPAPDEGN